MKATDLGFVTRREFIVAAGACAVAAVLPGCVNQEGESEMYGLIGKMKARPGQRDALVSILLEGVAGMPGCLSYVVARDASDAEAIWITEVWDSKESHDASLSLPSVRDAITKAKPMIAGFDSHVETVPVGGHGIAERA